MTPPGTSRQPFIVVPWEQNFLDALAHELTEHYATDLGEVLIIFPHARPARYLRRMLAARRDLPKPCLLPAMRALPRFISDLAAEVEHAAADHLQTGMDLTLNSAQPAPCPRQTAHPLDQVAVLREVVLAVAAQAGHSALAAVAADAKRFLPWGARLAALMEDIFTAGLTPGNFNYLEDSVPPFAAALLENLAAIHQAYSLELDRRLLTTPGYDAGLVARAINTSPPNGPDWPMLRGRRLILAGFYGLTGVEDSLFKHLWLNHGARIFVHSDARIINAARQTPAQPDPAKQPHWSCAAHVAWLKTWNPAVRLADPPAQPRPHAANTQAAPAQTAPAPDPTPAPAVRYAFYQGYDLHSQLTRLHDLLDAPPEAPIVAPTDAPIVAPTDAPVVMPGQAELAAKPGAPAPKPTPPAPAAEENTAVVLLDSGLLMPLLHHLPHKNINISMGYPLERSPLARLAELILRLQESRRDAFTGLAGQNIAPGAAPHAGENAENSPPAGTANTPPSPASSLSPAPTPFPAYHWREVRGLLRHPYLRMLERDGQRPLQAPLAVLEKLVRSGARFVSPAQLLSSAAYERELTLAGLDPAALTPLLARLIDLTVTAWEDVSTLGQAAHNLARLAAFLAEEGRDLWPRFPLDGEYLFRLSEHLAPQLAQSAFAHETLDQGALFAILREAVRHERVPFEADPLEGLQVLGMLETRLLSFERVLIIDATDDRLPGAPAYDPLLPDALRREMGLPGLAQREQTMAYTFNRLIRAAREAHIFYQTGAGRGGLLDEKKIRSRFVEELIWAEEQQRGALLTPGEPPLHNIAFKITPATAREQSIPKTEAISRCLEAWLQKPISPTALDVYLHCPVRFFYSRLAELTPPETVREGNDPAGVGEFLHAVLQDFFTPLSNAPLPEDFPSQAHERRLAAIYLARLDASPELTTALPYASYLMLKTTGLARLLGMLRKTPPHAHILALESELQAPLTVNGRRLTLRGKLDRVDLRPAEGTAGAPFNHDLTSVGQIVILDYKSGQIPEGKSRKDKHFWTPGNPLWAAMEAWTPDTPPGPLPGAGPAPAAPRSGDVLETLAQGLKSLQLPIYMYLWQSQHPATPCHAAFVDLARSGEEKSLFPAALLQAGPAQSLHELYAAYIPTLPTFVLRHLLTCRQFTPNPGHHCTWCPYQTLCRRGHGG